MSIKLSTSRPPSTTLTSLGGTGSSASHVVPDVSVLPMMLSVEDSDERVDEQLDDSELEFELLLPSELDSEVDGRGELALGPSSTSSVGVVGGEDGFLISSESRELTPLDSLPTGETSCFFPWLPAAATPRQSTLRGEIGDSSPKPSIRSPTVVSGTAMLSAIIQNRFAPGCCGCGSGLSDPHTYDEIQFFFLYSALARLIKYQFIHSFSTLFIIRCLHVIARI